MIVLQSQGGLMHENEFKKNWHQLKGKIQQKWNRFSNEDIAKINGEYRLFINFLQQKYSYTSEQAEKEMNHWVKSYENKERSHQPSENKISDLEAHKEWSHKNKDSNCSCEPGKKEKKHNPKNSDDKKRKAG